jgi:predicted phage tail protein
LDTFNCVAESILPVWDGQAWIERPTRNPAWAFADALTGAAAGGRAIGRERLDIEALSAWAEHCEAEGRWFDAVIDFDSTCFQILHDIAARGRASFHLRDGLYSIVRDVPQAAPAQHLTPRNSWGFKGSKTFTQVPHALRVRFVNPELGWQEDERLVFFDGYDESNASLFEDFEPFGLCDPEQAYKDGRYYLKTAVLRPETYELYCDVEHLVCDRGDRVLVTHDVPLWGLGAGRVKRVDKNSEGLATGVALDERLVMEADKTYCLRFRLSSAKASSTTSRQSRANGTNSLLKLRSPRAIRSPRPGTWPPTARSGGKASIASSKAFCP